MRRISLGPNPIDKPIAGALAKHGDRRAEKLANAVTRAGDEKVLLRAAALLAAAGELTGARRKRDFDYLLALLTVTSCLDHLSKHLVKETRPDRMHPFFLKKGIPKSGARDDAFPSGHALHLGALASCLARMYPQAAPVIWTAASGVAATRVLLLAHWFSDVAFGFVGGIVLDKLMSGLAGNRPKSREHT